SESASRIAPIADKDVIDLLSQLVAIKSTNPRDIPNPGPEDAEYEIGQFVVGWARDLGLKVRVQEVLPYRSNVLATPEGNDPPRRLLFEVHMGTVQAEGMTIEPFTPEVVGDRLYGRGACDAKGSLASMMLAMRALKSSAERQSASVTLAAVVDEEHKFRGVSAVIDGGITAEAAIVGEPTELDLVIAHKGCLRWRVATFGKSVHTSRADEGINAISKMAEVIQVLDGLNRKYRSRIHPLVGTPLPTVTTIDGGAGVNTVPDRCTINVDRHTLLGEDPGEVLGEIAAALEDPRDREPDLKLEMKPPYPSDVPMEISHDEPASKEIVSFLRDEFGIQVAPGLRELADTTDTTVRVGHMGPGAKMTRILPVLFGIEEWLRREAHQAIGVGVSASGIARE
ncbi:MAG: M20/M25/M40 family metallo-hydrolase, partial [Bacillota bacterium]